MKTLGDQIEEAVRLLVEARNCRRLFTEVCTIVDRWKEEAAEFHGDAAPLNALINVGLNSRDMLRELYTLVLSERMRKPETKKLEYQRQLMQRRRDRLRKALMLEELKLGRPMTKDEAETAALNIEAGWISQRRALLAGVKGETAQRRAETLALFWHNIDCTLTDQLTAKGRHG